MHAVSKPASRRLSKATAVVNWFTSQWEAGPKVYIAPTARHLPFNAPDDARGLHWCGEVHVVANQAPDSLAQTMVHEAVGHYGLRALLGTEWPHFMRHIQLGLQAGDPGLREIQQHVQHAYVDDAGRYYLTAQQEADEIAAYVAEDILCMKTGEIRPARPWSQVLEAVKGRLLREGLYLERGVSRSELEGMLLLAAKRMEATPTGRLRQCIEHIWESCCSRVAMSDQHKPPISLEESQRLIEAANDWERQVAQWLNKLGVFMILGLMAAKLTIFGMVLYGLSHVLGNTAAIVFGCAFLYFRDRLDY